MNIIGECNISSILKPYFNDFVITYLEPYYLEGVQNVQPENEIEERALTYFVKTCSCIKSINTLFSTGDIVSARILMRSLFELIILFKKIISDKEEYVRYSKAYEKFKQMEVNKINQTQIDAGVPEIFFSKAEIENNIERLKNEILELGFTPTWNKKTGKPIVDKYFEIKEMAISVDMEYEYNTTYKNLCLDTHTSSSHFYKYLFKDSDGRKILNLHPYLHELDLMISMVCSILMDFFDCTDELLGINKNCVANNQFQKLLRRSFNIMPVLIEQGQRKKNGFTPPSP